MDAWTLLLTILAGIVGFYYFAKSRLSYFKEADIPHLPALPLLGNMGSVIFRRRCMADMIEDVYRLDPSAKYVGMYDFMAPIIVLRDLELVKSVTIKNFEHFVDHRSFVDDVTEPLLGKNLFSLRGDRWKEMRTLLSPAFTSSKMRAMFKLMNECAVNFADYWATAPTTIRDTVDVKDAFTRYTNDVIATCAFGLKVDSLRDRENDFYVLGRETTQFGPIRTMKFFFSRNFPRLYRLLNMQMFRQKTSRFFMNVVETTIRTRDEQGIVRPDMIQLMMESRGQKNELTIEDMTSQAFIFFFGGFDTTSTLMCFAAHEIAVNPRVQARLRAEIESIGEDTKGELTYEALNRMKYLDAVLNEALRMYPVAAFLDRVCVKDFVLPPSRPDGKPLALKKGSYLWVPVYGLHMDPEHFPEPRTFKPERFLDDEPGAANLGAYVPFGQGPRMCIGNRFALMEAKVMLYHLLSRCELLPCEKTPSPLVLTKQTIAMAPEGGFWLRIQPRTKAQNDMKNGRVVA